MQRHLTSLSLRGPGGVSFGYSIDSEASVDAPAVTGALAMT